MSDVELGERVVGGGVLGAIPQGGEGDLFELELYGGSIERRYRAMRPEIAAMPWGTLARAEMSHEARVMAQRAWTGAAFQEHRTAVACAATLRALLEARAPIDLVGVASRFPLDEMAHVEMCSRIAMELGGGTEIRYDPDEIVADAPADAPPLLRAAELVVRFFCVGEALSIPLLRGAARAARHPLPKAVLTRIVKDEAAHGVFGFTFLDWLDPLVGEAERAHLGREADRAILATKEQWRVIAEQPRPGELGDALAWMQTDEYLEVARRSMTRFVVAPLRARGIPVSAWDEPG
jgi:hypothetical protein